MGKRGVHAMLLIWLVNGKGMLQLGMLVYLPLAVETTYLYGGMHGQIPIYLGSNAAFSPCYSCTGYLRRTNEQENKSRERNRADYSVGDTVIDDTIRVGDLVMVVKPRSCCPEKTRFGVITRITKIHNEARCCKYCKKIYPKGLVFANTLNGNGTELYRLKKINPPPIKESIEREVTA